MSGDEPGNVGNWGETVVLLKGGEGLGEGSGSFSIDVMSNLRFEGGPQGRDVLHAGEICVLGSRCYIVDAVCKGLDYAHSKSLHNAQNAQNEIRLTMHVYPLMHKRPS